jgi:hypothetical protein
LSYKEASKRLYGLGDYAGRIIKTTDYAKANGVYQSGTEGYGGEWWLRSPRYTDSDYARVISYGGIDSTRKVHCSDVGVVPALTVTE